MERVESVGRALPVGEKRKVSCSVSRRKALAASSETQFKTFANRFAEVLGKNNRLWKDNGTVPPKKFLTDANI